MTLPRKSEPISASILQKIKESLDLLNEKMEVMIELSKHGGQAALVQEGLPDVLDVMTLWKANGSGPVSGRSGRR